MNVYDSQVAEGLLKKAGYEIQREHEDDGSVPEAASQKPQGSGAEDNGQRPDVILMNTCSVREHAEDRVYSRLGMLGKIKRTNPDLIVGLMGCMVEEHKEKLFKRFPQLDLMVGTRNIKELAGLIDEVRHTRRQVSRIKQDGLSIEYTELINRTSAFHAWLPIMTGCNKVCTFCVVPTTRGSEVSMPAREVYREASRLVSEGVKCITLLGQNVNSYGSEEMSKSPRTAPDAPVSGVRENIDVVAGPATGVSSWAPPPGVDPPIRTNSRVTRQDVNFPELLDMLCQIEGLERISFTTSHPHDATEALYRVIAKNLKISRRFHLPLQSGSDRILKRMKRLHTYQEYKEKIDLMRKLIPDVAITTDIIAGFSGETEEDFEATRRALEEIRYDSAFIYKYSVRPGTPAVKLEDDVPLAVKEERHQKLLQLQKKIMDRNNREWLGKTAAVFVEQASDRNPLHLIGRTSQDRKVVFEGGQHQVGTFARVTLTGLRHETFIGTLCES